MKGVCNDECGMIVNGFTWSGDSSDVEAMRVIDLEVLLDKSPLIFTKSINRWEQIFRIDFVFDLLVSDLGGLNNSTFY